MTTKINVIGNMIIIIINDVIIEIIIYINNETVIGNI